VANLTAHGFETGTVSGQRRVEPDLSIWCLETSSLMEQKPSLMVGFRDRRLQTVARSLPVYPSFRMVVRRGEPPEGILRELQSRTKPGQAFPVS
jgi:hypothetical protein